jgi:hypothetical protein
MFLCFDLRNNFCRFYKDNLIRVAQICNVNFSTSEIGEIRQQPKTYILEVRRHATFSTCVDIASLASKIVETVKHIVFLLVLRFIKLVMY